MSSEIDSVLFASLFQRCIFPPIRTKARSLFGLKFPMCLRIDSCVSPGNERYFHCFKESVGTTRRAACSTVRSSLLVMMVSMKISTVPGLREESFHRHSPVLDVSILVY